MLLRRKADSHQDLRSSSVVKILELRLLYEFGIVRDCR